VFQYLELDKEQDIITLINNTKDFCDYVLEVKEDNNKVYSLTLKRDIYNLYITFAIYYSIIANLNIINGNCIKSLDDLEKFKDIYSKLGLVLNIRFLEGY
jgi:hypothetical protein